MTDRSGGGNSGHVSKGTCRHDDEGEKDERGLTGFRRGREAVEALEADREVDGRGSVRAADAAALEKAVAASARLVDERRGCWRRVG